MFKECCLAKGLSIQVSIDLRVPANIIVIFINHTWLLINQSWLVYFTTTLKVLPPQLTAFQKFVVTFVLISIYIDLLKLSVN